MKSVLSMEAICSNIRQTRSSEMKVKSTQLYRENTLQLIFQFYIEADDIVDSLIEK